MILKDIASKLLQDYDEDQSYSVGTAETQKRTEMAAEALARLAASPSLNWVTQRQPGTARIARLPPQTIHL